MNLKTKALVFATYAHDGQSRKYNNLPYIHHPIRVAASLFLKENCTEEMYAAALLHDVMEDCGVKYETLHDEFGKKVADLVFELTNVYSKATDDFGNLLPRGKRKRLERERIANISKEAKLIKLADRLDNIIDMDVASNEGNDFFELYAKETILLIKNALIDIDNEFEYSILVECKFVLSKNDKEYFDIDCRLDELRANILGSILKESDV